MLKNWLKNLAEKVPLPIYQSLVNRNPIGLYYHVVSDEYLPHIQYLNGYKTPRAFENDLIYLLKKFNIITYEQLLTAYLNNSKLKHKSIILTFDDGFSECFSVVRPLLLKHGIPCSFFVTTEFIDNKKLSNVEKACLCIDQINSIENEVFQFIELKKSINFPKEIMTKKELISWIKSQAIYSTNTIDQLCLHFEIDVNDYLKSKQPYMTSDNIKKLSQDGFSIGAHSTSHRKLGLLTDIDIEKEIITSCNKVMSLTGKTQVPFAFPFSADGVSRELLEKIKQEFRGVGLFFDTNGIQRNQGFLVSRICADSTKGTINNSTNLDYKITQAYIEQIIMKANIFLN